MSDPNLTMQRQIQALQTDLERLRKADAGAIVGTFVAGFGGSGGGGNYTQTLAIGEYTCVGDFVHIWAHAQMNAFVAPPGGNLWITGLPFTSRATQSYSVYIGYRNTGLATLSVGLIPASSTHVEFYDTTGAIVAASVLSAASNLLLSATYPI